MAISVSLINMKGGVGKTTLAAQLAQAAARREVRTLAVDLDPQANLSQALLSPERYVRHLRDKKPTIVQIFEQYFPPTHVSGSPQPLDITQVILKKAAYSSQLDLIVSRLELSHTLKNPAGKERRLAKALAKVADDYDLILIDCAPTESILTEAAYHASRYALVPVKPEYLATIGLPLHRRTRMVQRELHRSKKFRLRRRRTNGPYSKPMSATRALMPRRREKVHPLDQRAMLGGPFPRNSPDSLTSSSRRSG